MKLIIFGASGKTGLELVKQGLKQGHETTARITNRKRSLSGKTHFRLSYRNKLLRQFVRVVLQ